MYPTIETIVADIFNADWNITDGRVVPTTEQVVLKNGGKRIEATYLYADLAGSSKLAHTMKKETTATIVRAYINTASRILRHYGGEIRSFDGDRVMAIFMGTDKNEKAVRAAFAINWAVEEVIAPAIASRWTDVSSKYTISHGIGIDTGEALIVRGGVRDNNDLISIGDAPNDAARLSEYRGARINVTSAVYSDLPANLLRFDTGTSMWWSASGYNLLGVSSTLHHSSAYWGV